MMCIRPTLMAAPAALCLVAAGAAAAGEVNVYSYRQEVLIRPLLKAFTLETGIKVNLVSAEADALLERLKREGDISPADVLLTVDAGRILKAKAEGVLQPVASPALAAAIPPAYRDPEGYWYGLSLRARPILYAKARVDPAILSTYEDLADPKWRGKICIRSSTHLYNQSLLASLIAHHGVAAAEAWAKGLVANLARAPKGGDRDQLKAVAAGECDLAVANTYYLAGLAASEKSDERAVAEKIGVFWPNQAAQGTHVNISAGAVTRSSKNKVAALRLLEFLASDKAQAIYAGSVQEYPVRAGIPWSDEVEAMGRFKADALPLARLTDYNAEAVRVADRAGWK
ncbi:MAG: Fe(3+) ABC transporter substrate-binding protein [Alphaproteobacteria bacterium]|nr:Fe(3+) ABC transporter substrate-binding protein [Alphaproteobacteria bacterium]